MASVLSETSPAAKRARCVAVEVTKAYKEMSKTVHKLDTRSQEVLASIGRCENMLLQRGDNGPWPKLRQTLAARKVIVQHAVERRAMIEIDDMGRAAAHFMAEITDMPTFVPLPMLRANFDGVLEKTTPEDIREAQAYFRQDKGILEHHQVSG